MTKVTEQDVVDFLKEKVAQLTKELESAQGALIALQAPANLNEAASVAKKKKSSETGAAKRGRKPGLKEFPSQRIINADQLG